MTGEEGWVGLRVEVMKPDGVPWPLPSGRVVAGPASVRIRRSSALRLTTSRESIAPPWSWSSSAVRAPERGLGAST